MTLNERKMIFLIVRFSIELLVAGIFKQIDYHHSSAVSPLRKPDLPIQLSDLFPVRPAIVLIEMAAYIIVTQS